MILSKKQNKMILKKPYRNVYYPYSYNLSIVITTFIDISKISSSHLIYQRSEKSSWLPSDGGFCLGWVTNQDVNLSRTEIFRINTDDSLASSSVDTSLVNRSRSTLPLDGNTNEGEGSLNKFTDSVCLVGGKHVVIWLVDLKHSPHTFYIVSSMTPISLGIKITQVEALLKATLDLGNSTSNLSGDESRTTSRGLVIEKDTVTSEHIVCFTVVDDDPEGILLGNTVWRSRVERSQLGLRNLTYLSVKLRGRGLVELGEVNQAT